MSRKRSGQTPGPVDLARKPIIEAVIAEKGSMGDAARRLECTRSSVAGSARRLRLMFPSKSHNPLTEEHKAKIRQGVANARAKTGKSDKQVAAELREKRTKIAEVKSPPIAPKAKRKGIGLCMWADCTLPPVAAGKPFCHDHAAKARAGGVVR